jgi:hypothetical protein
MKLKHSKTGHYKEAVVSEVVENDYEHIQNSGRFTFDWRVEKRMKYDVYKICLRDNENEILGLLSLRDVKSELRIHVNLIEVSSENVGKRKAYERIAGCLLGFACQLSFEKSYDGFVSLVPKTELIDHYCRKYGFHQVGGNLAIEGAGSLTIIQNYL